MDRKKYKGRILISQNGTSVLCDVNSIDKNAQQAGIQFQIDFLY